MTTTTAVPPGIRRDAIRAIERLERTLHSLKGNIRAAGPTCLSYGIGDDLVREVNTAQNSLREWNAGIAKGEV